MRAFIASLMAGFSLAVLAGPALADPVIIRDNQNLVVGELMTRKYFSSPPHIVGVADTINLPQFSPGAVRFLTDGAGLYHYDLVVFEGFNCTSSQPFYFRMGGYNPSSTDAISAEGRYAFWNNKMWQLVVIPPSTFTVNSWQAPFLPCFNYGSPLTVNPGTLYRQMLGQHATFFPPFRGSTP